jgi:hypothetical protein
MRIDYLPEFWLDVVDAAEWFDEQRPGLGREFVIAVDLAIDTISLNPLGFRVIADDIRRFTVRRFRFLLFYEVSADRLLILGTVHGARDVNRWLRQRKGH